MNVGCGLHSSSKSLGLRIKESVATPWIYFGNLQYCSRGTAFAFNIEILLIRNGRISSLGGHQNAEEVDNETVQLSLCMGFNSRLPGRDAKLCWRFGNWQCPSSE